MVAKLVRLPVHEKKEIQAEFDEYLSMFGIPPDSLKIALLRSDGTWVNYAGIVAKNGVFPHDGAPDFDDVVR